MLVEWQLAWVEWQLTLHHRLCPNPKRKHYEVISLQNENCQYFYDKH